jgi:hypothetical protein
VSRRNRDRKPFTGFNFEGLEPLPPVPTLGPVGFYQDESRANAVADSVDSFDDESFERFVDAVDEDNRRNDAEYGEGAKKDGEP